MRNMMYCSVSAQLLVKLLDTHMLDTSIPEYEDDRLGTRKRVVDKVEVAVNPLHFHNFPALPHFFKIRILRVCSFRLPKILCNVRLDRDHLKTLGDPTKVFHTLPVLGSHGGLRDYAEDMLDFMHEPGVERNYSV